MKKKILGTIALGSLLLITGCNVMAAEKGEQQSVNINKDSAEQLKVELNIGVGNLDVTAGSNEWIEGTLEYSNKKLEPEVSYDLRGKTGKVKIDQQNDGFASNLNMGDFKNDWDLQLSEDVPMDLEVNNGASDTELNLSGLQLTSLEVNSGVGDLTLDLSGDWKESFSTNVAMGVGDTTMILPKDVGVKVTSSKGIGSSNFEGFISRGDGVYVNEAYKNADVILTVNMELGVGDINFKIED
ncbi:toast rack family protein [Bacillus sp. 31A1R]|uniref:Toast rack family protein n=1 Tax=Robertmurraya mangrovi TaxID=3098077 RepID=A0ABU5IZP3_9BACI|nr:toast rack family protein [Bacillus sp. 31A1R]MDZ5472591.1 toast rack family protein [Bacillus sp. 31A1R]